MKIMSILRTTSGVDEFPLYRALLRIDPDLINLDDRLYGFHVSPNITSKLEKFFNRLNYSDKFNVDCIYYLDKYRPDIFIIFKGSQISDRTIKIAKAYGAHVIIIYPDLDPRLHGNTYLSAIREADQFYFTKPNLTKQFSQYVRSDAELIMPLYSTHDVRAPLDFDDLSGVTFVGHYSRGKCREIVKFDGYYNDKISVIGDGWFNRPEISSIKNINIYPSIYGPSVKDLYRRSVCNLGLLMESINNDWPGDEITSRSVLVPASGGVLLHPRNNSSMQLYGASSPLLYDNLNEAADIARMLRLNSVMRLSMAQAQQRAIIDNATCAEDIVNKWIGII